MTRKYKHHEETRPSTHIKYRGKTGQIDLRDTIISIISKQPGLSKDEIALLIYPPHFKKSINKNVPEALAFLIMEGILLMEEVSGQYYLTDDALSHDIGKSKLIMESLMEKGISKHDVMFLMGGLIMSAEQAKSESEHKNYHTRDTVATSPVCGDLISEKKDVVDFDGVPMIEVEPGVHEPIDEVSADVTIDPFKHMTDHTKETLKKEAIAEIVMEQKEARLAHEAETAKSKAEAIAEAIRIEVEKQDAIDAEEAKKRTIKYKIANFFKRK